MKRRNVSSAKLLSALGSSTFFWFVVVLFIVQALWIAFSNRYPMAFDEDYHLGIIRLYAHHLSPFLSQQPANADMFGAVYRDPSYLYHYLMSFPYRLIAFFTHNQSVQVLELRFVNIGFGAASLVIFRRLLHALGASVALANVILLIYCLVPVVSLLGAQINYDNLFIPLVALTTLWTVQFGQEVLIFKRINSYLMLRLLVLCLFASLVKYAFLPIFAAAGLYVLIIFAAAFKHWRKWGMSLLFGLTLMTRRRRTLTAIVLVVAMGLFLQRYGFNAVHYHTPVPDCSQVLSVQRCSAYGPWVRDYLLAAQKVPTHYSAFQYMHEWLYGMWLRLFFTIDGPPTLYETRGPLLPPAWDAIVFGVASLLLVMRYSARLWRDHRVTLGVPLLMSLLYVVSLWLDGFAAFRHTGQPVAINGRYLLPILPPLFLLAALAWRYALAKRPQLKLIAASVAIVGMLWGGGVLTFVLRSSNDWYWPNSTMRHMNADVRNSVGRAVPGYYNPIQFLR